MKVTVLALACVAMLMSSGCDDSSDPTTGSSESTADEGAYDFPSCEDVWKVGATLDLSTYGGCQDGEEIVAAVTRGCYDANSEYRGQVATFEDRLWVLQEGTDPKTGEGGTAGQITDIDPKC